MTLSMLQAALLTSVESALNPLIASDPVTCQELERLTGKTIQIELSDLENSVYIIPFTSGVQLQSQLEGDADTRLCGTSNKFLQLLTSKDKTEHFFGNGISINGDTSLAKQFQSILANMRIDWEGLLAEQVGDLPAHKLSKFVQSQAGIAKRIGSSFQDNCQEYIQEEISVLTTRPETDSFMRQVDSLRERVDRLSARISALNTKKPN